MKTEQVGMQQYRENSSNPSTESFRLAEHIAQLEIESNQNNPTLKEYYVNLMDQLEIDGVPKEKISTIGSKIILEKKKKQLAGKAIEEDEIYVGDWWYVTAREHGCIDPHYSHPKNDDEEKPKTVFEIENLETISVIDDMMEFLKSEKQFLKHNSHDSKIEKNILRENIYTMTNAITHANERFNNKLKIAPSHYSILFRQFLESMSSHLSDYTTYTCVKRRHLSQSRQGKSSGQT